MKRLVTQVLLSLTLCFAAPTAQARDLVVFAAASLKNVMDDIAQAFEAANETDVVLSYAGSAALARQIQQGAPADVFVSANTQWMDLLVKTALVRAGTVSTVAGNRLVLISGTPGQLPLTAQAFDAALATDGRLAVGNVRAVPAGLYARAALEALDLWPRVADRIVQTENVRAALRLVTLGEAPLGIVYATDARLTDRVFVAATFPETSHPPIRYPAARTTESSHADADAFLTFLGGETAARLFAEHGFLPGAGS